MKNRFETKPKKKNLLQKMRRPFFVLAVTILSLFFAATSLFAFYNYLFRDEVYPGVKVDGVVLSFKTKGEVKKFFEEGSKTFSQATFAFKHEDQIATISGETLHLGMDAQLIAEQAFLVGRSGNLLADTYNKLAALSGGINLRPSYSLNRPALELLLSDFTKTINKEPIDAIFEMKKGSPLGDNRVIAFRPSAEGFAVDISGAEQLILKQIPILLVNPINYAEFDLPITTLKPAIPLGETNALGIKEHIAQGRSTFRGSIPNRMYNIALAASRIDGVIIPPGGTFSFNKIVGEISKDTGYKEAYIIKQGRTVLDDGGGVCQVSTTLFRAALAGGLPISERNAHAYRVAYYEQDASPGLDATVFFPRYDFKFKNDTDGSILIEATPNLTNATLVFDFYGSSDGRQSQLTKSLISNIKPAPEDKFEDDPTLPKGTVKQVDFKAQGATVAFSRTVKRDDEVIISETFTSVYRPWQAVFLRGTRE